MTQIPYITNAGNSKLQLSSTAIKYNYFRLMWGNDNKRYAEVEICAHKSLNLVHCLALCKMFIYTHTKNLNGNTTNSIETF